ncbi:MAG: hypothetical protein AAFP20_19205 [Cyanobacteria bacterium J06614_10]
MNNKTEINAPANDAIDLSNNICPYGYDCEEEYRRWLKGHSNGCECTDEIKQQEIEQFGELACVPKSELEIGMFS